jgi:SAM-dependent methyltransferase
MSEVFGPVYAESYDALYHDKDYEGECDLIERLLQTFGDSSIHSVIDLGCGTGGHAIRLAEREYQVAGIDLSESMLDHARRKAADHSNQDSVVFHSGDIREVNLHRTFDAALMMFAVLGYQLNDRDAQAALKTARRHLRPGGLLVFDIWYGPAVLQERPSLRVKEVPTARGKIVRSAEGELDQGRHTCTVRYQVWRHEDGRPASLTKESHTMRYFFPDEIELLLAGAGFAPIRVGKFPEFEQDPDESSWSVICVARAI